MFKMAFQVSFSAKNVQRFGFVLLVTPKLKNKGDHNAPKVTPYYFLQILSMAVMVLDLIGGIAALVQISVE